MAPKEQDVQGGTKYHFTSEALNQVPVGTQGLLLGDGWIFIPSRPLAAGGAPGPDPLGPIIMRGDKRVRLAGVLALARRMKNANIDVEDTDYDILTSDSVQDPITWVFVAVCSPSLGPMSFKTGETALVQRIRNVFSASYPGLFAAGHGTVELERLVVDALRHFYHEWHAHKDGTADAAHFVEDALRHTIKYTKELDDLLVETSRSQGDVHLEAIQARATARALACTMLNAGSVGKHAMDVNRAALKRQPPALVTTTPTPRRGGRAGKKAAKRQEGRGAGTDGGRGGFGGRGGAPRQPGTTN